MLIEMNGVWISLEFLYKSTSGKYHLDPFLAPTAILSLVGTCCTAKGLIDATALLIESLLAIINTSVWSETTLLIVEVWVESFMDFDRGINLKSGLGWGSFLARHLAYN